MIKDNYSLIFKKYITIIGVLVIVIYKKYIIINWRLNDAVIGVVFNIFHRSTCMYMNML